MAESGFDVLAAIKAQSAVVALGRGKLDAKVNRADALMYAGHAGQELGGELSARFEELARQCEESHKVSYVWRVEDIDGSRRFGELVPQVVLAGSGLVLEGADISAHLRGASKVAIFACTLGAGCDRELRRLGALSPLDQTLYDCCASSLAEAGAQEVQELLGEEAAKLGLEARARFSPGYGDLPLSVQPAFLQALDAGRAIGLGVTESMLLSPVKSVTAVLGFFDPAAADSSSDPCDLCAARAYCCYRERGTTCRDSRRRN